MIIASNTYGHIINDTTLPGDITKYKMYYNCLIKMEGALIIKLLFIHDRFTLSVGTLVKLTLYRHILTNTNNCQRK